MDEMAVRKAVEELAGQALRSFSAIRPRTHQFRMQVGWKSEQQAASLRQRELAVVNDVSGVINTLQVVIRFTLELPPNRVFQVNHDTLQTFLTALNVNHHDLFGFTFCITA